MKKERPTFILRKGVDLVLGALGAARGASLGPKKPQEAHPSADRGRRARDPAPGATEESNGEKTGGPFKG